MKSILKILRVVGFTLLATVALLVVLAAYWMLRPNQSRIAPGLAIESWDVVSDGTHNSNTDMIDWQGAFYLVHATSPYHFASEKSRLVLLRSQDAQTWEPLAEFDADGEDIRDPKFAAIGGQLILYALKNTEFAAEPYGTVYSVSSDGITWTPFQEIEPKGWLFWRPKSMDGLTWYVPAYWHEHNRSALLSSSDGIHWKMQAPIHSGDRNDETDIEFLPDGRLLATARLEYSDSYFGHPQGATLIAQAKLPYTGFRELTLSDTTRLDGPNLFRYNGRIYAVGRYQPVVQGPVAWQGSIFAKKRTALFEVRLEGLVHLSDLPSAGDTSYAGVVVRGDTLYTCYYTSDIRRDYPWIVGMVSPSSIRMAQVDLPSLEALAVAQSEPVEEHGHDEDE